MSDLTEVRCYIEEYATSPRVLGLRLREKNTGRSVVLGTARAAEHERFMQFLLAGRAHRATLPGLFDSSDEQDSVLVSGRLDSEDSATITFVFDETLSYQFV